MGKTVGNIDIRKKYNINIMALKRDGKLEMSITPDTVLDKDAVHCKVRFCGEILDWTLGEETKIPEALQKVMETVCKDYTYLLR